MKVAGFHIHNRLARAGIEQDDMNGWRVWSLVTCMSLLYRGNDSTKGWGRVKNHILGESMRGEGKEWVDVCSHPYTYIYTRAVHW